MISYDVYKDIEMNTRAIKTEVGSLTVIRNSDGFFEVSAICIIRQPNTILLDYFPK